MAAIPRWVRLVTALVAAAAVFSVTLAQTPGAGAATGSVPDYWETYAPQVRLDPNERYLPTSAEHLLANATLRASDGSILAGSLTPDTPELTTAPADSYLEIAEGAYGGLPLVQDPTNPDTGRVTAPMYVTEWRDGGFIEVTYWMVYGYNGCAVAQAQVKSSPWWMFWDKWEYPIFEWCAAGRHAGDIERVTVKLAQDTLQPVSVTYRGHSKDTEYSWGEIEIADGTHPVVYPGLNTHANYPKSGRHDISTGLENAAANSLIHLGNLANLFNPGPFGQNSFSSRVGWVKLVDHHGGSPHLYSYPDHGYTSVVWEPWNEPGGVAAIQPGTPIWAFEGDWGQEFDNATLAPPPPLPHDTQFELFANKWALELGIAVGGQKTATGPKGPLQKGDVGMSDVVHGGTAGPGSVTVEADETVLCEGDAFCVAAAPEGEEVIVRADIDQRSEYVVGWSGHCEGSTDPECVIPAESATGYAMAVAWTDTIGLTAHGPGPTGFVSVYDAQGTLLCDTEPICEIDGVLGDTFTVEAHLDVDDGLGIEFLGWSDFCEGDVWTCDVTLTEPTREFVSGEIAMPMATVSRTLDQGASHMAGGFQPITGVSGSQVLDLELVSVSADRAVFEMASEPTTIRSGAIGTMASDHVTLETLRFEVDRETVREGHFSGSGTGIWERRYVMWPGFELQANWDVSGSFDWETGNMELALDDENLTAAEWPGATFAYTALWP